MRLKLFQASTMTAAMAQVRSQLGPDALILSTRRIAGGVEVTAALEPAALEPALDALPPVRDAAQDRALGWHGVPPGLIDALPPGLLSDTLPDVLMFGALPTGAAPLLLTGPPGAGKTLTTAKLATRMVMAGKAPSVITADGQRAGAPEQLAAYTRLLGLTLVVASTPVPLSRALARRQYDQPVLIDTPGVDPFDSAAREDLLALAATADAVTVLALPAGLDPGEAHELADAFAQAGATLLIVTRLDLSRRLGGVLAAASARLTLTEAGIGPGAADGLRPLTPEFLASRLSIPPGIRSSATLQDVAS